MTPPDRNVRMFAIDASFDSNTSDLAAEAKRLFPVECPFDAQVAWACWDWRHNCMIVAMKHDTFRELCRFELSNADSSPHEETL